MSRLTERDAEKLPPEQATALVRVLELQARWSALVADQVNDTPSLQARQRAHDASRAGLRQYAADYHNAPIPEPTQNVPDRLAVWCRALRAVFRRAEGGCPAQVLARVYRLADRIAARARNESVVRVPVDDLPSAVRALDAVIAWCEGQVPTSPRLKPRKGAA
jgi:hypothetical protein